MFAHREAGVLCHPTSLPGRYGMGEIGPIAHRFVEKLAQAGQAYWQMLPINPTGNVLVPYSATSSFAGNPMMIDVGLLREEGWLSEEAVAPLMKLPTDRIAPEMALAARGGALDVAGRAISSASGHIAKELSAFVDLHGPQWLNDYALWEAISIQRNRQHWIEWPADLRDRETGVLAAARVQLEEPIRSICALQFVFENQWNALRRSARSHGVKLIGDMPIFVAHNSADVWARPDLFKLDDEKRCLFFAGAPPDYFSEHGQLWGNPVYRWDRMLDDGFAWWSARVERLLHLVDCVRIDHFRGFAATWETPAASETAAYGHWGATEGWRLFEVLKACFPEMPFIAEDLGHITDDVIALRDAFDLPGLKILQFEFGDGPPMGERDPTRYPHRSVCYPATHDNNTMLGWLRNDGLDALSRANDADREARAALAFTGAGEMDFADAMVRAAMLSGSGLALVQLQDVMGLDGLARMNTPGTVNNENWSWRFAEGELTDAMLLRLKQHTEEGGRHATTQGRSP